MGSSIQFFPLACVSIKTILQTTGKLLKQVVADGFCDIWTANVFRKMEGQCS
jgi:hypothetical protein